MDDARLETPLDPPKEPPWGWLAALGGAGLALYLGLSLWVFLRHLGPSVRVEHAQRWHPGRATPLRVELRDHQGHSAPLGRDGVQIALSHPSRGSETLGVLPVYVMRRGKSPTRAQAMVQVPETWPTGFSSLELRVSTEDKGELIRHCKVEVSTEPAPSRSSTAIAAADFVQQSDPSDAQPKGALIELRPKGVLRASLPGRYWLRLSTDKGEPLQGRVVVKAIAGEFRAQAAPDPQTPKLLVDQALPSTGLLDFEGTLLSEQLGVQVQLLSPEGKVKHERKIYLRAFPGASSLDARVGASGLQVDYASLVQRRRASVDLFDLDGHWVAQFPAPLWPGQGWQSAELSGLPQSILQLEAYAGVRSVQPNIPAALVFHGPLASFGPAQLKLLLDLSKDRLARWPKKEREPTRRYFEWIAKQPWGADELGQFRRWLLETLPAGRFAAPLVQDTRVHAKAELDAFRQRWKLRLRWFLWLGFALFAAVISGVYLRHASRRNAQLSEEMREVLMLGPGLWLRLCGVLMVSILCVWLLGRMMESLV